MTSERTVITDVRVVDGDIVDPVGVVDRATVVLDDGRIVTVTPGGSDGSGGSGTGPGSAGAVIVDGRGATLMPGLVDAHTHAQPGRLEQALACGVTTEIDLFNDPATVADLRRDAASRDDLADVRSAGTGATAPGGHPSMAVDQGLVAPFPTLAGPGDAEAFVEARLAEGADLLKIFVEPGMLEPVPALDEATVAALARAARARGLVSVAHTTDVASARVAVRAGVDALGHVPCDRHDPDLAAFVADHGVAVIPTLVMLETLCGRSRADELPLDVWLAPRLDRVSRDALAARWPVSWPSWDFDAARATVADLHSAGVPILAGSDAVNPGTAHGASLHRELELLVEVGLSPGEALAAATAEPARLFGLADRGHVAPGLRADLLLVDGDPRQDVTAARRIRAVWRRGVTLAGDRVGY